MRTTSGPDHDAATLLRSAGLRVTEPRLAVLDAVQHHPHAMASVIADAVHATAPNVSVQTVYNCLAVLTDSDLVRRIELPGSAAARYEWRRGDNHHHLVCRSCGEVQDVACAVGHAPCLSASDDHGYVIDEAEVIYRGLCAACQARGSASTTSIPDMSTHPEGNAS